MFMSMNPLLYYAFAMVSLLCACSGKQGPTPPPILAAYGDFEYAEHDTTWLQQLPVVTFKSEMLFTDGELSDAGLQGAAALYPQGEGLAYLSRYPYLLRFEVGESGDCRLKGIINIDPSNSDGTPVISTTAPGSGQPAWRSFPVVHAVRPLGDCWIVSTSAMASLEHLRLCRDGTMTRVQLLDPNGDYVGMFITNTVGDIMYGSIYKDGKRWYVALRES